MTPAELARARRGLEAFTAGLFEDLTRCDQRARGACYVRGCCWRGAAGPSSRWRPGWANTNKQALHHFIHASPWDFEGRSWPGWHHHVTLVSAAHAFVTLQRLDPKARASA